MSSNLHQIYCQKCRAGNPVDQDLCNRCGTRLMLVIEPSVIRHDEGNVDPHESYILERISNVEYKIARLTDRLEKTLDLLLQQSNQSYIDHTLLEALLDELDKTGLINWKSVQTAWRTKNKKHELSKRRVLYYQALRTRILNSSPAKDREKFANLIDAGFNLLESREPSAAIRSLASALSIDPLNIALTLLISEELFYLGKIDLAERYSKKAYRLDPTSSKACLLLGIILGDQGDLDRSKTLLKKAIKYGNNSFTAFYALGRLYAIKESWSNAIVWFKRAISCWQCPELFFLTGYIYYQLNRDRLALKYIYKAFEIDNEYAEAIYLLGYILWRMGDHWEAVQFFKLALSNDTNNRHYRAALNAVKRHKEPALPALIFDRTTIGRRLLSSGDARLAELLRVGLLNDFSQIG
jgi:tetratricopeptide (TPR) repeat protein